jgi:sugar phosphate isomerase/epimerase
MRVLSLAHLTLAGSDPLELIEAAEQAGFSHIGMRIVSPNPDVSTKEIIGDVAFRRAIKQRLADSSLTVMDIEAFWISPRFNPSQVEAAFALGAELGARYVVVAGNDPDQARTIDALSGLCELADRYDLKISLEFTPYSEVRTLKQACDLLATLKKPNAGLLIDALHLSRSGGRVSEVGALPAGAIHFLHLCDAPALVPSTVDEKRREARGGRLYPGEGDLPLRALISAAPDNTPVAIEAPHVHFAKRPWAEQARLARSAAMRILAEGFPSQ